MKLIVLTSLFQKDREDEIRRNSKGKPIANANSTFQHALLQGLEGMSHKCNDIADINCVNMPNIGAYPFNYTKSYFEGHQGRIGNIPIYECSFLNVAELKHRCKYRTIKKHLQSHVRKDEMTVVLCYDLYAPWFKCLQELKVKFDKLRCFAIVPDLPSMTGGPNTLIYKLSRFVPQYNVQNYLGAMDGYILLAENMARPLGIMNKPRLIIEGIYNYNELEKELSEEYALFWGDDSTFKILYTGALSERNGLDALMKAVCSLERKDIRLIFCGAGELESEIVKKSKQDSRIVYVGQVSHEVVLAFQRQADLLVNPRRSDEDFAKYSFPSKTMEYMASGTPVMMYKLPTLPTEYEPYLYIAEDGEWGLEQSLRKVMAISPAERKEKGEKARQFIIKNKNAQVQAGKILKFITSNV